MKFVKFLTRKYTLLEHSLIMESMFKKNTSIKGIYYSADVDISKNGLIDMYAAQKDIERNRKWVNTQHRNNKHFIKKMLQNGFLAVEKLSKLPRYLPNKISKLNNNEIIKELFKLRKKLFDFGGYFDFTFYVEDLGINLLDNKIVKKFSQFHDYRKKVFLKYFDFLKIISKKIAEKEKLKFGSLNYLSFNEIIDFLKGKIKIDIAISLQKKRKKCYIVKRLNNSDKEIIITDNFVRESRFFKKYISEKNILTIKKIRGISIYKGKVKGRVKKISQISYDKTLANKIIVMPMTLPSMVPLLKKSLAIVTDEGGLLCHAALVAREFKIPCIVGTKIATKVLHDGDLVEVDANKGIVGKIE